MKSKPQAPTPVVVNPGASSAQQATFNKEAALQQRALNLVDQYTPQGSVKYAPTGAEVEGIPTYQVTQEFSPEQQGLYDTSTRLAQKYGDIGEAQLGDVEAKLSTPFDLASLGAAPTVNEATRGATRDAILARLQPQSDLDRAALETSLANQGFVTGTQAYDDAMDQFNRSQSDLYLGADIQSGAEMANMFGLEGTARDRAINEILMERDRPMTELAAFMGGTAPTKPSFVSTPQGVVSAPDYMGAAYASADAANRGAQNTYNQGMGSYNANLQGLYGLGGAGAQAAGWAWSDRRLKRDIRRIGTLPSGLAVYSFRYLGSAAPHVGVMAQEAKARFPEAVAEFDGFLAVDYGRIG